MAREGVIGRLVRRRGGIRIDVIYPYKLILHQDLALLWRGEGEVGFILQYLYAPCFLDEDSLHGFGDWRHGETAGCGVGVGSEVGLRF